MIGTRYTALVGGIVVLLWTAVASPAEDDEQEDLIPVRCISMGRIRTTTIIDDSRILFHQRGGRVFLNTLERQCVGLARSGKFTYQVQGSARAVRLCDTDTITVLERSSPGFTCGLGEFQPIPSSTMEQLLNPRRTELEQRAITGEPVELPKESPTPPEER